MDNKTLVAEYMDAFGTFDPSRYHEYLADDATYMVGMSTYHGKAGFDAVAQTGKVLYPRPAEAKNEIISTVAEGDWVAVLLKRRGPTNKIEDYENVYGVFFEVRNGKIQTQVELMDFRVSTEAFDTTVLQR